MDLGFAILLVESILYGTRLGASTSEVGWIGSAYGFSYLFMPAIIGRFGDRLPRKSCLLIAAIAQLSIAFFYRYVATKITDLIVGQLLLGVANGFHWPALEAYISEKTAISISSHTRGMANFCIAWSVGYSLGPLLAGLYSDYNIEDVLSLVVWIFAINFITVLFGLPPLRNDLKNERISVINYPNQMTSTRETSSWFIGMILYASVAKVNLTYFANYAKVSTGLAWSGSQVGVVLLLFGLGRTSYFLLGGFIKNSRRAIQCAFFIIGFLLMILTFCQDPLIIAVIMGIFGFFGGLIYLQSLELLLRQESKLKGAKAGLFESAIGLGGTLSPLFAGFLGEISLLLPFLTFACLILSFSIFDFFLAKN